MQHSNVVIHTLLVEYVEVQIGINFACENHILLCLRLFLHGVYSFRDLNP